MLPRLLLYGLGNPGNRYRWTRHNLGFHVVEALAQERGARWSQPERTYEYADCEIGSARVALVKPMTYMNLAGIGLRDLGARYEVEPSQLLVIADDIALPLGQLRLRRQGSHGGHNGLLSIIDELGTTRFPRLRLGVGPVPDDEDAADYVLAPFAAEQRTIAEKLIGRAVSCIEAVVDNGFDKTMSLYNSTAAESESD
jgi:PTH1 family peptidyl-tRNA hydrolase